MSAYELDAINELGDAWQLQYMRKLRQMVDFDALDEESRAAIVQDDPAGERSKWQFLNEHFDGLVLKAGSNTLAPDEKKMIGSTVGKAAGVNETDAIKMLHELGDGLTMSSLFARLCPTHRHPCGDVKDLPISYGDALYYLTPTRDNDPLAHVPA